MKYSFVLLAYNQQDFIAEAVKAALAQEGPAIEIVISDDCSTDRTFEIIKEIVADYRGPHQVLLNRNDTNIGVVAHIRKANAMSSGDILIAASGDDISRPDRSRRIIEAFETTNAWLVHSHASCIDLEGKEVPPTYLSAALVRGADLLTVAKSQSLYLGATAAFDRNIFRKYGYVTNPNSYEDLVYGFRASLENGVHFIDDQLVKYRVGSGISTHEQRLEANEHLPCENLEAPLGLVRRIDGFHGVLQALDAHKALRAEQHAWVEAEASAALTPVAGPWQHRRRRGQ
jgi:glycosyltransferase involved in cell wall biosynthesis